MPRRKPVPLNAWETVDAKQECHYVRLSKSLLQSEAFKELGYSARCLYVAMTEACAGKRQFRFTRSDYLAYGIDKMTFFRARDELVQAGFLKVVSSGKTTRKPNVYEWSLDWKGRA